MTSGLNPAVMELPNLVVSNGFGFLDLTGLLKFYQRCLASSIFSLGDNHFSRRLTSIVTGGNERERVEAVLLRESRGGGKVGNLVLVFHFSIRFVVGLWECGNRAAISKDCGKRVVLSISPSFPEAVVIRPQLRLSLSWPAPLGSSGCSTRG